MPVVLVALGRRLNSEILLPDVERLDGRAPGRPPRDLGATLRRSWPPPSGTSWSSDTGAAGSRASAAGAEGGASAQEVLEHAEESLLAGDLTGSELLEESLESGEDTEDEEDASDELPPPPAAACEGHRSRARRAGGVPGGADAAALRGARLRAGPSAVAAAAAQAAAPHPEPARERPPPEGDDRVPPERGGAPLDRRRGPAGGGRLVARSSRSGPSSGAGTTCRAWSVWTRPWLTRACPPARTDVRPRVSHPDSTKARPRERSGLRRSCDGSGSDQNPPVSFSRSAASASSEASVPSACGASELYDRGRRGRRSRPRGRGLGLGLAGLLDLLAVRLPAGVGLGVLPLPLLALLLVALEPLVRLGVEALGVLVVALLVVLGRHAVQRGVEARSPAAETPSLACLSDSEMRRRSRSMSMTLTKICRRPGRPARGSRRGARPARRCGPGPRCPRRRGRTRRTAPAW